VARARLLKTLTFGAAALAAGGDVMKKKPLLKGLFA
jgi:hypothetical protein